MGVWLVASSFVLWVLIVGLWCVCIVWIVVGVYACVVCHFTINFVNVACRFVCVVICFALLGFLVDCFDLCDLLWFIVVGYLVLTWVL